MCELVPLISCVTGMPAKSPVVGVVQRAHQRRTELLVKRSGLKHPERAEKVFVKQVIVIRVRGPQIRIPNRVLCRIRRIIFRDVRDQLIGIRTRDPAGVNSADIGILRERITQSGTGQRVGIRVGSLHRHRSTAAAGGRAILAPGRIQRDLVSQRVGVSLFQTYPGHESPLAHIDRIHYIGGAHPFNKIPLIGQIVLRCLIAVEEARKAAERIILQKIEIGDWSEMTTKVSPRVIVVVAEGTLELSQRILGRGPAIVNGLRAFRVFVRVADFSSGFEGRAAVTQLV